MMNDDRLITRELAKIESEKQLIEASLDSEKIIFANQIQNGLGDIIKKEANIVSQPIKYKIPKKHKFKNSIKKIFKVFGIKDNGEN